MDMRAVFLSLNEPLAAGLYEDESRGLFYRKALALRRYYESVEPPVYAGEPLYPSGVIQAKHEIRPSYLNGFALNGFASAHPEESQILKRDFLQGYSSVPREHTLAGNMYTHSMPDFESILRDGFDAFLPRIGNIADPDLRDGLTHLLAGIKDYWRRCIAYLERVNARPRLIDALRRVPFSPCQTLYEAIVGWNFILYLDSVDNMGDLANGLSPYDRGEDVEPLLKALFTNLDANNGFSMQLGMNESESCHRLSLQCLRAARGMRRPMIELFVDENTPRDIWEAAIACIRSGSSSPAFYNRALYRDKLQERFPSLTPDDLDRVCGGGCTEIMISGRSNVGSLDAGINLMLLLRDCIDNDLTASGSFEVFYNAYMKRIEQTVTAVTSAIHDSQLRRAAVNPLPMRTLLVDGCIENGRDFNNGGARYLWSIVSFAGIVNAVDSLLVIRDEVFIDKRVDARELIRLLNADDVDFLTRARHHHSRFGIDNDDANALSRRFSHEVFHLLDGRKTAFGWGFIPASIQFESYARAGEHIAATPDGRKAGEPLADSLTAIFGKDTEGPTALLRSVASLDLSSALGTPVVNFTIRPDIDSDVLRALIEGYFALNGMQMQITCISKATLADAYEHPENHENLVVRVGGYSEYFNRLTDVLKRKIIDRTIY